MRKSKDVIHSYESRSSREVDDEDNLIELEALLAKWFPRGTGKYRGVVRFGNDSPCMVKGKGTISLNGKRSADDVYWVEGLKNNILSVAQLNDKGYLLEFKNGMCKIYGGKGELIATNKHTKDFAEEDDDSEEEEPEDNDHVIPRKKEKTMARHLHQLLDWKVLGIYLHFQHIRDSKYIDVKLAFLNGILEEEVYIEKPDGYALTNAKDMVCKLHKTLYGLKQKPRTWYERLHSHLMKIGFLRTSEDNNIYLKSEGDKTLVSEVFVDDIIFGGNDDMSDDFVNEMKSEFEMSLVGEIKFFIGCKVSKEDDATSVDEKEYKPMIGKLHYVVHCRPDIAHAVGLVARFQKNPKETHLTTTKEYSNI
ncbi:hypothetical protein SUGI_0627870 [Cryptomeria japonica]|nr:hypothetical protein SUGI_0627870 [Cryptomeria japonica]